MQTLLRQYLDIRIQEGQINSTDPLLDKSLIQQAILMQEKIWNQAIKAAERDNSYVTSGLFIQSLNHLIDSFGSRNAVLNRHVP